MISRKVSRKTRPKRPALAEALLHSKALSTRRYTVVTREVGYVQPRAREGSIANAIEDPRPDPADSGATERASGSSFTGDYLVRTCNQGKIVDICRPSAGRTAFRRAPRRPHGCHPSVRPSPHTPSLGFLARCNAPKSHVRGRAHVSTASSSSSFSSHCSSLRRDYTRVLRPRRAAIRRAGRLHLINTSVFDYYVTDLEGGRGREGRYARNDDFKFVSQSPESRCKITAAYDPATCTTSHNSRGC